MSSVELASAYISLVPSAAGITGKLQTELGAPLTAAGKTAGEDTGKHFSEGFKRNIKIAAAAGAVAIVAVGKASIEAASNLDESVSKINVVFGDNAGAVKEWAKGSAEAFGLSTQQALEATGTYGNLFSAFGLGKTETKDMSQNLVGLAADLASFNNTTVDEALLSLRSGLSGETEPLKKYGIAISDARLKTEALALGLITSTKDALTPAAKAQASYSLIMKDTALAQGDFGRTSDGLANKQRIMAAKFSDLQATIGQALLPVMSTLVGFITDKLIPAIRSIGDWLSKHKPILIAAGIVIGTALVGAFVAWATAAWAAFAANVALAAPIIAIGVAIAALVAGVIWAYQNLGFFRAAVDAVVSAVMWLWHNVLEPVASFFADNFVGILKIVGEVVVAALTGGISEVIMHWDEIVAFFKAIPGKIVEFFTELPGKLLEVGKLVLTGLWDGIKFIFDPGLKAWFLDIPVKIALWLFDAATWLVSKGKEVLVGLLTGLGQGIVNVSTWFGGLALKVAGWIVDAHLWLIGKGKDVLVGLITGLGNGIFDVTQYFINLPGKILGWLGDGGSILLEWGKALIGGIWSGIKAGWNFVAAGWNSGIGSFGFEIPSWIPVVGGKKFDMPDLPILKAAGGPVSAGASYIIGERGPELFVPHMSGTIIPNGEFGTATAAAPSMTINISTMMGNPQEIWRAIEPVLRNYHVIT